MSDITSVGPASAAAPSTTAPLEVNSGDSAPVTFDELNEIEDTAKRAKKAEKSQIKEAAKEAVKEVVKDKKSSAKEGDEKPKETKDKKAGEEKDEGLEADQKPKEKKLLKAKSGDKELDLDPDTLIPVRINGQDSMISVKDLQSNFSGKTEWDKRFQQLDKDRRDFKGKYEQASNKIKAIFQEKDPEIRIFRMAEYAGVDPLDFREKMLTENINLVEKWYTMSDAEKEADRKNFENRILKTKLESREKEDKEKQSLGELDQKIQKARKTHGVSEEDFLSRYDEIESLINEGKFKGDVTPEFIVETIVKDKLWNAAEQKLHGMNVKLPIEKRGQIMSKFVDDAYAIGITDVKVISEMAEQIWKTQSKEEIIQSKVDDRAEFLSGKKETKKVSGGPREVLFFDEI